MAFKYISPEKYDTHSIKEIVNSDIFLKNLIKGHNRSCGDESDNTQGYGENLRWFKFYTTDSEFIKEGAPLNKSINLLSVKQYTKEQSLLIESAIESKKISFTRLGHICVLFKENDPLDKGIIANDIAMKNGKKPSLGEFSGSIIAEKIHEKWSQSYFYNKDIMFDPTMKWILYKNKVENLYYLLYNPIHRKPFQRLFIKLLEINSPNGQDPWSHNTGDPSDLDITFNKIIKKYCNAFIIKDKDLVGRKGLSHFADPACSSAFSMDLALFSLGLSLNITPSSLKNDYFPVKSDYGKKQRQLQSTYRQFYPYCSYSSNYNPAGFIGDITGTPNSVGNPVSIDESDSFIQVIFNWYKYYGKASSALSDWSSLTTSSKIKNSPCDQRSIQINTCTTNITTGGDIEMEGNMIENNCGTMGGKSKQDTSRNTDLKTKDPSTVSNINTTPSSSDEPPKDPGTVSTPPINTSEINISNTKKLNVHKHELPKIDEVIVPPPPPIIDDTPTEESKTDDDLMPIMLGIISVLIILIIILIIYSRK